MTPYCFQSHRFLELRVRRFRSELQSGNEARSGPINALGVSGGVNSRPEP